MTKPTTKNPDILKLIEVLDRLPEWLEAKREKRRKRLEFIKYVWEDAILESSIPEKLGGNWRKKS